LPDEIFADEQVRRVQEELRKRHLFYANPNGEKGPALSIALRRYQLKKGFPATGVIDSVTLASLGIPTAAPSAATTPVVIGKRGQVHGANGETLPTNPPFLWPSEERVSKFDPAVINRDNIELALPEFGQGTPRRRTSSKRIRLTSPEYKRDLPFEAAFDSTSQWTWHASANPAWSAIVLQPGAEISAEFAIDDGLVPQVAGRPERRSARRTRRVKPRKETNPLVLTYQSVNRAIRSLFGDSQSKKKRTTAKRL
jgi:peptidoglycan hydrolase-like protein with peptidoglycan-binding domain